MMISHLGNLLAPIGEEALDRRQGLVSYSIMMESSRKALMWNFIKHLAEVQQNGIDLLASVEFCSNVMHCNEQLGLTGFLLSEAMQYLVAFQQLN